MAASTSDEILQAALGLSTRERMRIARNLLESIEDEAEPDPGWEEAWRVEIERRMSEVRDGTAVLEDSATVLKELRAELAARRKNSATAPTATTKKPRRRSKRSVVDNSARSEPKSLEPQPGMRTGSADSATSSMTTSRVHS
jgi:putative addiction module component (TIGR02574 family)